MTPGAVRAFSCAREQLRLVPFGISCARGLTLLSFLASSLDLYPSGSVALAAFNLPPRLANLEVARGVGLSAFWGARAAWAGNPKGFAALAALNLYLRKAVVASYSETFLS